MTGYGRQCLDDSDIQAVVDVLRSDYLTQGPAIEQFEAALCRYTGARYAVAVNSGTAALYCAYAALDIGPGKRLWTSPVTFVATVNAALLLGAEVDYVDVDVATGNMNIADLECRLQRAAEMQQLPDVIVPVHLAGRSCDMISLQRLSTVYGFKLVEDACHGLGGEKNGLRIGACARSNAAVLSFHPVKSITTGEGGAVLTNDKSIALRVKELRQHGITREPSRMHSANEPAYHYEQHALGFNFRLSDIQAALGVSQMKKLDEFICQRRTLATEYLRMLQGRLRRTRLPPEDSSGAWHLFSIVCESKTHRDALYANMASMGYRLAVHYPLVYRQPWHRKYHPKLSLPLAEIYSDSTLSLPLYPGLQPATMKDVVDAVIALDQRQPHRT